MSNSREFLILFPEKNLFKGIYFALAATFEDFVKAHRTGNDANDTRDMRQGI